MMKNVLFLIIVMSSLLLSCKQEGNDSAVEKILSSMSLEEKVGQMTMICLSEVTRGRDKKLYLDTARFREFVRDYHIGSFLSGSGSAHEWYNFIREAQEINMTESSIPLLIGIDHIHGANYVNEGTFFPHNLSLSCSFDTSLVARIARVTAMETANLGLLWNFAPVLDLGRNPYWPRLYETYGEDPLLASQLGSAYISSYQNYKNSSGHFSAACAKHFIGYSDPRSGFDRSPAEIPDQVLHELFLPAFREAVNSGVKTVMLNSGEVNGVPVHISRRLVTELLREELGFEGVVLTDIKDIMKVTDMHRSLETTEEAVVAAVEAGIDISMSCNDTDFFRIVTEKVRQGVISEERINESVRRILKLKMELGLFEDAFPGYEDASEIKQFGKAHRDLAHEAAGKSIVLIKNEAKLLPLEKETRILVAGIAANSKRILNGAWTLEWLGAEEERQPEDMKVLTRALQENFPAYGVTMACETDFENCKEEFLAKAAASDVILLTIGEEPYSEFKGNITELEMEDRCRILAKLAFSTGKPVIIVVVAGRPRVLNSINERADAVIFAGYPGIRGAEALADILSGEINPSGKLSFSYPSEAGLFSNYYHKPTQIYDPLYAFGHGLSYTTFEYSGLKLSDTLINENQSLEVELEVKNSGAVSGEEVVLLYITDSFGRITRPVKKLIRFTRTALDPGKGVKLSFVIKPGEDLGYPDRKGNYILEEGGFVIHAGSHSASFRLKKTE